MLEKLDLSRTVSKAEYRKAKDNLDQRLAALQRKAKDLGIPIIIVFEGWGAAGKGTLINELILPLDPRGFTVYSTSPPTEEEALHPFLWRFWPRTPARGRIAVFDRSWYRLVSTDRVDGPVKGTALQQAYADIVSFERLLADGGNVILKFFLHISKQEQKRRFRKLESCATTAWRVTKADWRHHKDYEQLLAAAEDMLAKTDSDFAPWTVVAAHDRRYATLRIFTTVVEAIERHIAGRDFGSGISDFGFQAGQSAIRNPQSAIAAPPPVPAAVGRSILDKVDLTHALDEARYRSALKRKQKRVRELEYEMYLRRVPVAIVFEGWDAAGKGGAIRRLTQNLDPRGYQVVPIGAPNDIEKAHHYLWRFWTHMPKAGHMTLFDRSWYGRVLVERVEGLCAEGDWRRAYHEINLMEQHLTNFGTVLVKFWLQIDRQEQLRRFKEREGVPYKQWKITEEDWRNRTKWRQYKAAVEEMLFRTSTPSAPWTIVEANCKWYARIKVLDTVINAIKERLKS